MRIARLFHSSTWHIDSEFGCPNSDNFAIVLYLSIAKNAIGKVLHFTEALFSAVPETNRDASGDHLRQFAVHVEGNI